jgi:hypothetical protein
MASTKRTRFGRLTWMGEELGKEAVRASKRAIDETTEAAALRARTHHPGWKSVTGTAEGSIGTNPARLNLRRIRGSVTGGEGEAFHLLILEVKNGAALRSAADAEFPKLPGRLSKEFRGG